MRARTGPTPQLVVRLGFNPFKPSGVKRLHIKAGHTGLMGHTANPPFFDIRAPWRSVLSATVPERPKNKNGGLDQCDP